MIVVDASVAVKTYLAEDGSDAATEVLTAETRLLAPELIRLEVAAALCRRVRKQELRPDEAHIRIDHWFAQLRNGLIVLTPDQDVLTDAVALSLDLLHPVQDCLYLAVARRFDASLITADRVFVERVGSVYPRVRLLVEQKTN